MILLQKIREAKGFSRSDLAKRVNVGINTIWRWEKGQRVPDLETIKILAQILNCSLDELVRDDPSNPTVPAEGSPTKGL